MFELFAAPLAWVGQKTAEAVIGQLAERGVKKLTDRGRQAVVVPAAHTRHRLGDVTSDVDIAVRHRPATGQRVLLTFQATPLAGERTSGVTVPMVLGETAHLTLPRADYLISALVFDHPADPGAKPVLRGVGGIRHYVASTKTEQLTIETGTPTAPLLTTLGLADSKGTGPFQPAPHLPATATSPAERKAAFLLAKIEERDAQVEAGTATRCRAATSGSESRCPAPVALFDDNGTCYHHLAELVKGVPVYDFRTGRPIT
ncbi:hypothetical protein [Amycolatopsis sp. NPDC004625]|uniref:hypothetical protein n=1 Tax=Amycolatopsis sp. NPDC004625 TaxID=3154670 RepID=UPI0033A0342C